jgi:hypothetical protein
VIDTNVLIVANGKDATWPKSLATECARFLDNVRLSGGLVRLDESYLILKEYGNKLPSRGRQGAGDAFYL